MRYATLTALLLCASANAMAARGKSTPMPATKVNDETSTEINDTLSVVDLGGIWFFHDGDEPMFSRPTFDDRSWTPKRVPTDHNTWNQRWQGYGWYRRHIYASPQALGQDLMLSLGPAREVVDVYMNGVLIMQRGRFGSRLHGDARVLPLRGLIPPGVLQAGENVIAVRVYDPSYTCGLPAGPIIIGPPQDVIDRVSWLGYLGLATRVAMSMMCLCLAIAHLGVNARRRSAHGDHRWAVAAGLALSIAPLAGTGILTATFPSLDLALRIPSVAMSLSLMFFLNYFATRYDDFGSRRARIGVFLLVLLTAFIFLSPDSWLFFIANPAMWVMALLTTLYAAHILLHAVRRQELGAVPVFVVLLSQIGLLVYDGLVFTSTDVIPAGALLGAVAVLTVASLTGARESLNEHRKTLLSMLSLRKELESRVWMDILQATVNSISRPQEYLDAVAHEIAREMGVRRCSIILPDSGGQLYIVASKGLPRQARHAPLQATVSISRHVFATGVPLTPATLPAELKRKPEDIAMRGNYDTQGFVAHPIRGNGRALGVLNVTDLNDGGVFNSADEAHVALLCERLALVLDRLHLTADIILQHAQHDVPPKTKLIKAVEHEPAPEATKILTGSVGTEVDGDEITAVRNASLHKSLS